MNDPLFWSVLLLLLGLVLILLELFVPSGGIIGILAGAAVLASIIVAFTGGPRLGAIMMLAAAVGVPAVLAAAIHWWPATPLGRMILIQRSGRGDDVLPDDESYRNLKKMVGKRGKAKSKMLPSGAVLIEGRTYDAVSEGMAIDPGQTIRVVAVRTNRIVVRPVDAQEPQSQPQTAEADDDILSRPIDALGLEPLDDPLA
jgi:membrane-bound ClpP family serine protease